VSAIRPPHDHGVVVSRFVEACSADDRIVAALLVGSLARGEADEYSDIDLCAITTDDGFESVLAEREALIRRLGVPLFIETFGHDRNVHFILEDGAECELLCEPERALGRLDVGPFEALVDKRGILGGARFPFAAPDPVEQRERLREILTWFWHDLSHLITALGRDDLWWAQGQIEQLRRDCVNLVRIRHGVDAQEEAHEKLAKAIPVSELSPLQATFCATDRREMLHAALAIVAFFREQAPRVAESEGGTYPSELASLMSGRLEELARELHR
jgi:predicted nucleotidyltransferase